MKENQQSSSSLNKLSIHTTGEALRYILMDRQFECIRKHMEVTGINLNTTAQDEHVPEIEWYIQTIKERISVERYREPLV